MKQAVTLTVLIAIALLLAYKWFGYDLAYDLAFGTLAFLAMAISGTFFWLYKMKFTPLALGMAFSWLGAAMVVGWWLLVHLTGGGSGWDTNPLLYLFFAPYVAGALLHFRSIEIALRVQPYWLTSVMLAVSVSLSLLLRLIVM